MNDTTSTKRCSKCGKTYPATPEYFQRNKGRGDGLHSWCKPCKREDQKIHNKRYYKENREKVLERVEAYTKASPEKQKARHRKWYLANKATSNARSRENDRAVRRLVIEAYGGKCACCSEDRIEFLAIDHINGGGRKHRKSIGGRNFYRWVRDSGFPGDFRVLCHNCNMSLGFYGYCPHNR